MHLRDFIPSDLGAVTSLYVRTFNQPPWADGWTEQVAGERLSRYMAHPDALGVVAFDGTELVGFALGTCERWVNGEQFHLKEMCTAPGRQRLGVGGAILQALSNRLRSRGVCAVFLETRSGTPAAAFYKKHGFGVLPFQLMSRREPPAG